MFEKFSEIPKNLSPPAILAFSFAILIFIGSLLLYLPFAHVGKLSYLNSLFTATSAVCVTGLTVVDTGTKFTFWGQVIIVFLIQLGGLGLMTVSTVVLLLLGKSPSIKGRLVLQNSLTYSPTKDIFSLVKIILLFTFATELIGALILGAYWHRFYPLSKAIFYGIFHAISAFCNAGFSLFTTNLEEFSANYTIVLTIASLLILGGLGFLVIYEIFLCLYAKKTHFSLHTKLTLITTLYLILGGTALFFFFEKANVLKGFSLTYKIINSFFQAVTPRTAGFNTLPIAHLTDATLFLLIILMFIGASPGSCGGGIKTTTFAVFLSFIKNKLQGREKVHILFRTLPNETVQRAITVATLSGVLVAICTILLLLTQRYGIPHSSENSSFLEYLFEIASAFGTVGLSMGKTPTLNCWGKITLSLLMFIGRVGPLTVAHLVKIEKVTPPYQYSEENVMVG